MTRAEDIAALAAAMANQAQAIADGTVSHLHAAALRLLDNADTLAYWTKEYDR